MKLAYLRTKRVVRYAGSLALHFAHGGLVVVGLLAAALLVTAVARPSGTLTSISDPLAHFVPALFESQGGMAADSAEASLTAEQRHVADYVARKFHVAVPAVEPLVREAYIVGPKYNVDPILLLAVMSIESGFNPIAESVFGAQGLMQVIPKFHMEKISAEGDNASLLDPLVNIRVGAQVIHEYVKSEGGLQAGLQKYAGAVDDPDAGYSAKVFAERARLYQVAGRKTPEPFFVTRTTPASHAALQVSERSTDVAVATLDPAEVVGASAAKVGE